MNIPTFSETVAKQQPHDSRTGESCASTSALTMIYPSFNQHHFQAAWFCQDSSPPSNQETQDAVHVVQVQTYPPAYFPPLRSSWQTPQVFFPIILLKSTQVLTWMLAGVGSDTSSSKPGRDLALKRTPSPKLADMALVSQSSHTASLLHSQACHLVPSTHLWLQSSIVRAGVIQSSLGASEGELRPFKPPQNSG